MIFDRRDCVGELDIEVVGCRVWRDHIGTARRFTTRILRRPHCAGNSFALRKLAASTGTVRLLHRQRAGHVRRIARPRASRERTEVVELPTYHAMMLTRTDEVARLCDSSVLRVRASRLSISRRSPRESSHRKRVRRCRRKQT